MNGNERVAAFATSVPVGDIMKNGLKVVAVKGKTILQCFLNYCKLTKTKPAKSNINDVWNKFQENEKNFKDFKHKKS